MSTQSVAHKGDKMEFYKIDSDAVDEFERSRPKPSQKKIEEFIKTNGTKMTALEILAKDDYWNIKTFGDPHTAAEYLANAHITNEPWTYRPNSEDYCESRTSWDDLKDMYESAWYALDNIKDFLLGRN